MTLTATICSGFEAIAAALASMSASPCPTAIEAAASSAPDGESGEFVFYTLDVAFTPYGPEILHCWIPASVERHTHSEIRKGDLL